MKLATIMNTRPVTVLSGTDLTVASDTMAWADVRHLVVLSRAEKLVGILSEHDIVRELIGVREEGEGVATVDDVMTKKVQTAGPDDSLTEAAARLAVSEIGCLPITQLGRLIGLVTRTDVLRGGLRQSTSSIASLLVAADLMTRDPATIAAEDYLLNAAGRMQSLGVRHLPVVNGARELVGMLSDRDVRAAIGDPTRVHDDSLRVELNLLRVKDAMTAGPISVQECDSLSSISALFIDNRLSAVPVIGEDGRLTGIVSYLDLLRANR